MTTYVEYKLDDQTTILVEAPEDAAKGIVKASKGSDIASVKAKKSFTEALRDINAQAKLLLAEIGDLHVEEAEVKFGINTVGELGNIAIGKVGVGANYEITLKWKKPTPK